MPVITTNIIFKPNDNLRNKCTGTIENPKLACASPYDCTEPVILLCPEDMHTRLNHQPTMCSHIKLKIYSITINGKIELYKIRTI